MLLPLLTTATVILAQSCVTSSDNHQDNRANNRPGTCINIDTCITDGGSFFRGFCSGTLPVCCFNPPLSCYDEVSGNSGECIGQVPCEDDRGGSWTSGLCPGPSEIRCCLAARKSCTPSRQTWQTISPLLLDSQYIFVAQADAGAGLVESLATPALTTDRLRLRYTGGVGSPSFARWAFPLDATLTSLDALHFGVLRTSAAITHVSLEVYTRNAAGACANYHTPDGGFELSPDSVNHVQTTEQRVDASWRLYSLNGGSTGNPTSLVRPSDVCGLGFIARGDFASLPAGSIEVTMVQGCNVGPSAVAPDWITEPTTTTAAAGGGGSTSQSSGDGSSTTTEPAGSSSTNSGSTTSPPASTTVDGAGSNGTAAPSTGSPTTSNSFVDDLGGVGVLVAIVVAGLCLGCSVCFGIAYCLSSPVSRARPYSGYKESGSTRRSARSRRHTSSSGTRPRVGTGAHYGGGGGRSRGVSTELGSMAGGGYSPPYSAASSYAGGGATPSGYGTVPRSPVAAPSVQVQVHGQPGAPAAVGGGAGTGIIVNTYGDLPPPPQA